jgi:hypothetical protein
LSVKSILALVRIMGIIMDENSHLKFIVAYCHRRIAYKDKSRTKVGRLKDTYAEGHLRVPLRQAGMPMQ